jgi:hypothetical protein
LIRSKTEILSHIVAGKSDKWIARDTHHGRDLIRGIRHDLSSPRNLFNLEHPLGARRKATHPTAGGEKGARLDDETSLIGRTVVFNPDSFIRGTF